MDAAGLLSAASVVRVRGNARDRLGGAYQGIPLLLSTCLAVLYILLASWFFTRIHRHAVRTGLLARYSAESAS